MSEAHVCNTKLAYLLQFRHSRSQEIEDFFIIEIIKREKMYADKYADKYFFVLSGASCVISPCSFTTVISKPVGVASASFSLVFLINNGIIKMFLKTMGKKKISIKRLLY